MKENIGYCPSCKKIVFRRGEIELKDNNRISFQTKCPHCQTLLKISVGAEILIYKYQE